MVILPVILFILISIYLANKVGWDSNFLTAAGSVLLGIVVLNSLGYFLSIHLTATDTEYLGGYVTGVRYEEAWNEETSTTVTDYCTDDKGYSYVCGSHTETSIVDHPPQWYALSTLDRLEITQSAFEEMSMAFGGATFVEMSRRYHSRDGDLYKADWSGNEETLVPVTTSHQYENRLKNTKNSLVSNFVANRKRIFRYPPLDNPLDYTSVLTRRGEKEYFYNWDDGEIDKINALYGSSNQIRIWVLIWVGESSIQDAFDQISAWQGGNKNELVICLGLDDPRSRAVSWSKVFSWSKSEDLKQEIESYLISRKFDGKEFARWLRPEIRNKWTRREFKDFSYIKVEPPPWVGMLSVLYCTIGVIGLFLYARS